MFFICNIMFLTSMQQSHTQRIRADPYTVQPHVTPTVSRCDGDSVS